MRGAERGVRRAGAAGGARAAALAARAAARAAGAGRAPRRALPARRRARPRAAPQPGPRSAETTLPGLFPFYHFESPVLKSKRTCNGIHYGYHIEKLIFASTYIDISASINIFYLKQLFF